MKRAAITFVCVLLLLAPAALAQSGVGSYSSSLSADNAAAVRQPHWNFGVIAFGGSGLSQNTDVQLVSGGFRVGRVLTGEHGTGFLRGTLEWNAEFLPVDSVLWSDYDNVYGIGVNPLILKWNFTSGHKTVPYFLAQTGFLWSSRNVPPGDTSQDNFVSGAGIGLHHFFRPDRSFNIDLRALHLSNASIGNHNPGINASLQLSIGYNWWRH
jgi:lipid A 3-O-deacylase